MQCPFIYIGGRAHKSLQAIVHGRMLKKDVPKLSPGEQTSSIEAYHKVVTAFAPKSVHYHYPAMKTRYIAIY